MKFKFGFFVFLFSLTVEARMSAIRGPDQTYTELSQKFLGSQISHLSAESAFRQKKSISMLSIQNVPELKDSSQLSFLFDFVRDTKFILRSPQTHFDRRLSWLFPDDGCYVRAEIAAYQLGLQGISPVKIFAFGNLQVKTSNHPDGVVRWWYHVVIGYRLNQQVYVIDPAIEPRGPLTLQDWNLLMDGAREKFEYSICSARTYEPDDLCDKPTVTDYSSVYQSQIDFLGQEWDRLTELNRDPNDELQDSPPWRTLHK